MLTNPAQIGPILNNLKFLYPKPAIDPRWVTSTLLSIQEKIPGLTLQQQIKQVNLALLESDLERSTLHGTGFPLELITGSDMMHKEILFQGQKQGCLVMIMAITEIGTSAYNLKRTLDDKREVRSGRAQIRRLPVEDAEDELGNGKEEDEKEGTGPKYTRSMLKFTLSDGVHEVEAMEYKRIPNLMLGETRLGCKLVLQNVKVLRGLLLLTPENCSVKGYSVPQWCEGNREEIALERSLNDRLGINPEPEQHINVPSPPISPQGAQTETQTEGQSSHHEPINVDFDDDDIAEKMEEDYIPEGFELMPAHMPSNTISQRRSTTIEKSTFTPILAPVLPSHRAAPSSVKEPAPKRQNSSDRMRLTMMTEEERDLDMAIADAEGMNEDDWAALDEIDDVGVAKKRKDLSRDSLFMPTNDQAGTSSRFFRPRNSTAAQSRPTEPSSLSTAGKKEPIVLSDEEETTWMTFRSSQLGGAKDHRSSQQGVSLSVPNTDIIEID